MPELKLAKQEAYAQAVASGLSQSDAYRKAYPSSLGWKADAVHNKSSAMARKEQVKARIDELRAEVSEKALWTREDSVKALIPIVEASDSEPNRIAALKVLNDMHGYNAPIKTEVSGPNGGPLLMQTLNLNVLDVRELQTMKALLEKAGATNE